MGRGRDLNPGKRLHRPLGYQATSPRPLSLEIPWFGSTYRRFRSVFTMLIQSPLFPFPHKLYTINEHESSQLISTNLMSSSREYIVLL